MNVVLITLGSASVVLSLAVVVGTIVSASRADSDEPAACEHAEPGFHCGDASCPNSEDVCVRCNTPKDAPWYSDLECSG